MKMCLYTIIIIIVANLCDRAKLQDSNVNTLKVLLCTYVGKSPDHCITFAMPDYITAGIHSL